MDFLNIAYVKGGHWVCFYSPPFSCPSPAFSCHSSLFSCSSSPFSILLFPPSFHGLPSVPFLLFYTRLCFLPVRILSPYPYHFLLSLIPVLHPLFLSSTLLPLCPPLICIIFIRLFYLFIFLHLLIFHVKIFRNVIYNIFRLRI